MNEIEEATIKVVVGAEKKSRVMTDKEKKLTAYHEGGHAVATYFCEHQDPVHQISIIPRGMAGGYTMHLPTEDRSYQSRKEMLEALLSCWAAGWPRLWCWMISPPALPTILSGPPRPPMPW